MSFYKRYETLSDEVMAFLKKTVDDGVTFGNPCHKKDGKYFCYMDADSIADEVQLEDIEVDSLCEIADTIVEMNKNLGFDNRN